jgi:hypothetical protein
MHGWIAYMYKICRSTFIKGERGVNKKSQIDNRLKIAKITLEHTEPSTRWYHI